MRDQGDAATLAREPFRQLHARAEALEREAKAIRCLIFEVFSNITEPAIQITVGPTRAIHSMLLIGPRTRQEIIDTLMESEHVRIGARDKRRAAWATLHRLMDSEVIKEENGLVCLVT